MKKISKKNALILLIIGIFVITASQIISRFVAVNDLSKGSFIGIGIGLLFFSIAFGNFKTAH